MAWPGLSHMASRPWVFGLTSTPRPRLELGELIDLIVRLILFAPLLIAYNVARGLIVARMRGLSLWKFAECSLVRTLVELLSPQQVQFLLPTDEEAYILWLAKTVKQGILKDDKVAMSLKREIEPLPDGKSSIFWLGDRRKASKFVLFLHGGGYLFPMDTGHIGWCMNAYLRSGFEAHVPVAVAILQYSLCPDHPYPVPLAQAAEALGLLLARHIEPKDIVFGGDSCGGHLTASLLGHLIHPRPGIRKIRVDQPFQAAFMVSPWLTKADSGPTFMENAALDMLSSKIVRQSATNAFKDDVVNEETTRHQGWALPLDVHQSWFWGLDSRVKQVYITVGEQEVLRDEGIQLAKVMQDAVPRMDIRLEVRPGEAHDFILLEGQWNITGKATKDMKIWYSRILNSS